MQTRQALTPRRPPQTYAKRTSGSRGTWPIRPARARTADPGTAVLLAVEGLPDATAGIDRPYVPEAELQLNGAWRDLRERLVSKSRQCGCLARPSALMVPAS